jgi:hypothetical protein
MMLMYAFERRGRRFILAFACGCGFSSAYGFLAGTWPFGVVEAIWALIALRRYVQSPPDAHQRSAEATGAPNVEPQPDRERVLERR